MPTFEHTIDVAAPIEHVFAFMTDTDNWLRTNPSLTNLDDVEETDDGYRMNATYRTLGISNRGELELTVVEPEAHSVVSFDSPGLSGDVEYRFTEVDGVTTVVQSADYEFGDSLLNRIIEPVGKRYNERQFRHSLESSKELIEAELEAKSEGDSEQIPAV